jgi:hypothetical protein
LQFAQLAPARLANLPNGIFAALNPGNCIANLTVPQAAAIAAGQAGAMTALQFAQLAPARLANLPNGIFAALNPGNCIANLTALQAAAITAVQAVAMTAGQIMAGIAHLVNMGIRSRSIPTLRIRNEVRNYIQAHAFASPPGFIGGGHWGNYLGTVVTNISYPNNPLPGGWGNQSHYFEYDIYPFVGIDRGPWRIVTNGAYYYYTGNHYYSFLRF